MVRMKLLQRQYLFVNVADTNYSNYGTFRVMLPQTETGKNIINRLYIKKAIIPYNWRRVDSTTKTITIDATDYYLTEGNPNILDLITELNTIQTVLVFTFNRITSRIEITNQSATNARTFSTTAWEMMGAVSGTTYNIGTSSSISLPNPVDVRPSPILEIRVDMTTAGQEVFVSGVEKGVIRNTGVLCAIGIDVPMYSHKVWVDDEGFYFADVSNESREITFRLTDPNEKAIIPQTSPYFVIAVATYRDDERELLETQKEALKLQQYNLLLSHGMDGTQAPKK